MNHKIYYFNNLDKLKEYEDSNDFSVIKSLLSYYYMIDQYEGIRRILSRNDLPSNEELIELKNYYHCILALEDKNDYLKDKYYYYLNEYSKIRYEIHNNHIILDLAKIFYDRLYPKKRYWLTHYKYLLLELYITYYFIYFKKIPYFEKRLKKEVSSIIRKSKISFIEFHFLIFILDLYRKLWIVCNDDSNKKELLIQKLPYMDSIIKLLIEYYEVYSNVLSDSKKKNYMEIITCSLRVLIGRVNDKKKVESYIETIQSLQKYNKHIEFISNIANISPDQYDEEAFIHEIKRMIQENDEEIVSNVINLYAAKKNNKSEQNHFIQQLENLKNQNISNERKEEIDFGINEYKFWKGKNYSFEYSDRFMNCNSLIQIIFSFKDHKMNYNEFLEKLNKIDYIDTSVIMDWSLIKEIFKDYDFDWVITIIIKLGDISAHDVDFLNMVDTIFKEIANGKRRIVLSDFNRLEYAVSRVDFEYRFACISSFIYMNIYNVFDDNCRQLIEYSLLRYFPKLNVDSKEIIMKIYVYSVLHIIISFRDDSLVSILLDFARSNFSSDMYSFIYGISLVQNNSFDKKEYIQSILYLQKLLTGEIQISEDEYRLIGQLAMLSLEKNYSYSISHGDIYLCDNGVCVHSSDYIEELEMVYSYHNIQLKDDIKGGKRDNLLFAVTHKIYFKYIEKFHAGKTIHFSTNATGEEILEQMAKELNYDITVQNRNKIFSGVILKQPWLNVLSISELFKTIKLGNSSIYKVVDNCFFNFGKHILHATSFILLSKIGILFKLKDIDFVVLKSTSDEIKNLKENNIIDLTEILDHSQVACDDLIDSCYNFLNKNTTIIEDVPSANILGIQNNHLNKYDSDLFKKEVLEDGKLYIITDDPFYLKNITTSYSTLSYLISLYVYSFINSKELKTAIEQLKEMNYCLKVDSNIYNYLLDKSSDSNIHDILKLFE